MSTKIEVTEYSQEYRGLLLFGQVVWFPYSLTIDWAEIHGA